MTARTLINASNVSKSFLPAPSLWGLMQDPQHHAERPFACRDVSVQLCSGQVLGIVGKNGSGKSTLLRLLAGITEPSQGVIERAGRVCSLIELTPGYDLQASGRANARLGAALQGLSDVEIEQVMPEIEAFADIGAKFDEPLRTYSSGMIARVAFATIVHCRPSVLLIDEVLAVGDEAFQRKCFARLRELVEAGCAVAFVSHSAQLVTELCDTAILLEAGQVVARGAPRDIINRYYQSMSLPGNGAQAATTEAQTPDHQHPVPPDPASYDPQLVSSPVSYQPRGARISQVQLVNAAGHQVNQLAHGYSYSLNYRIDLDQDAGAIEPACLIKTSAGVELAGMIAQGSNTPAHVQAGTVLQVQLPFICLFTPGTYFCNVGVRGTTGQQFDYLHRILDVLMFKVNPDTSQTYTGLVDVRDAQAAWFSAQPVQTAETQ